MDLELVERAIADFTPDGPDAPGLAVGVYSGGRAVHTAARGVATVESDAPIDARTRFDIASASKQFTAACVLMLAHEGRLSLDDDIRKHVPELALESEVTIGQCLNHTGGLPEWYALQAITGVPLQALTEERLMKIISRIRRTTFEPGTAFSYSNTGYVLAAVVVRRVTGKSLAEFAAERVFGPLGMDDTVYRDDASVPLPRMAFGYAAGPVRADTEEGAVGDGGLVTSVSQLAPWFGFLADGRVLGTRLRDALLERPSTCTSAWTVPLVREAVERENATGRWAADQGLVMATVPEIVRPLLAGTVPQHAGPRRRERPGVGLLDS
ncbi:serine hydrolase domain-containing protein [Microtetraspora malaysiensis]|uniref:serine hydrolase domain-containing protein n=1 Tax=Microtetraspora malaysiensis TaxID=161358 RepID=UPI003D8E9888